MKTKIASGAKALEKIKTGSAKLADAVCSTLGPRGRSVIFQKQYGGGDVTRDGVTVARAIRLEDPAEDLALQTLKEAASKTNDVAGDGTTSSICIANALIQGAIKNVVAGADPLSLKRGIEKASKVVIEFLKTKMAKPVSGAKIQQIASISASDPEIGKIIFDAVTELGPDGVITVSESPTVGITKEIVKGMRLDRGYLSPYFITNEKMEAVIEDALILLTDHKINNAESLMPALELVAKSGKKDVVIMADDVAGGALNVLLINKLRGTFNGVVVKNSYFGDMKKSALQDIAALTGGRVISEDAGEKLESITTADFGRAEKIIVTKDHTTIIGGKGEKSKIDERAASIKSEIAATDSDYEKTQLKGRLGRLVGGVGIIKVGAATETEAKEIRYRIEDSLNATQCALAEGAVPGGGVALVRAAGEVGLLQAMYEVTSDEALGVQILRKAIEEPLKMIAENAGQNGEVVLSEVKKGKDGYGYNALTGKYEDLEEAGIIDPLKVCRCALENAVSCAGTLLTTNTIITIVEEKTPDLAQPPQMM